MGNIRAILAKIAGAAMMLGAAVGLLVDIGPAMTIVEGWLQAITQFLAAPPSRSGYYGGLAALMALGLYLVVGDTLRSRLLRARQGRRKGVAGDLPEDSDETASPGKSEALAAYTEHRASMGDGDVVLFGDGEGWLDAGLIIRDRGHDQVLLWSFSASQKSIEVRSLSAVLAVAGSFSVIAFRRLNHGQFTAHAGQVLARVRREQSDYLSGADMVAAAWSSLSAIRAGRHQIFKPADFAEGAPPLEWMPRFGLGPLIYLRGKPPT